MKSKINYERVVTNIDNKQYSFLNVTRVIKKIPSKYYENDYYELVELPNDSNIDLTSYAYYGKPDYFDIIIQFNNIPSPLSLPKSSEKIEELSNIKFSEWLNRLVYKGKEQESVPDVKFDKGVWYIFKKADSIDSVPAENEQIASMNDEIASLSVRLSNIEEEYALIENDSSELGSFKRKQLRQDIIKIQDTIFNYQDEILLIQNESFVTNGEWVPTSEQNISVIVGANLSKVITNNRNKILKDLTEENEKYRYLMFPKREYINEIVDIINET